MSILEIQRATVNPRPPESVKAAEAAASLEKERSLKKQLASVKGELACAKRELVSMDKKLVSVKEKQAIEWKAHVESEVCCRATFSIFVLLN